jgi:DNA-binding XRE family transcriptional regulator
MISAEQMKGARAMLDMTQDDLAQACGLSLNTIHSLENGHLSIRSLAVVKKTLESKGFEFYGKNGLSLQTDETRTYEGEGSWDKFYDDLLTTAKDKGGEVVIICKSHEILAHCVGATKTNLVRLQELSKFATIKCILTKTQNSPLFIPFFECKGLTNYRGYPWTMITFGDKTAIILTKNGVQFSYVVIKSIDTAQEGYLDFEFLWNAAIPLTTEFSPERRTA